jgi:hypothetical protein
VTPSRHGPLQVNCSDPREQRESADDSIACRNMLFKVKFMSAQLTGIFTRLEGEQVAWVLGSVASGGLECREPLRERDSHRMANVIAQT